MEIIYANRCANNAQKIKFACETSYLVGSGRGVVVVHPTPEAGLAYLVRVMSHMTFLLTGAR